MKIHTKLTSRDVHRAAMRLDGVTTYELEVHGSRTHARRLDVRLEGTGERHTRWANGNPHGRADWKAATRDDWGHFLAALYDADPSMRCVDTGYTSRTSFHVATKGRYNPNSPNYDGGTK